MAKLGAVFGTFIGGALMLDVGRKRLGLEEIASHVIDTHFESSSVEFHGILCRGEQHLPGPSKRVIAWNNVFFIVGPLMMAGAGGPALLSAGRFVIGRADTKLLCSWHLNISEVLSGMTHRVVSRTDGLKCQLKQMLSVLM